MKYRIYPPIGIARLGNSPSFFVGPENRDEPGVEIADDGSESPVTSFKDASFRVKPQAARFRLFQFADDAAGGEPAVLPQGAVVTWTVRLVNKKDAVVRPNDPPAPPQLGAVFRPTIAAGRENRVIDSQTQSVAGANAAPNTLSGTYLKGTAQATQVALGHIRTDGQQRLLVVGANGKTDSPEGMPIGEEPHGGGYYANAGWYDDVGDGPVTAVIRFADGSAADAVPGWVVVAPPDFAPDVRGVVTLYDDLVDLAGNQFSLPQVPTFHRDIQPILARASSLQYVNTFAAWGQIDTDWASLSDPATSSQQQRSDNAQRVLAIEKRFSHSDATYSTFRLRTWQKDYLNKWVAGNYVAGWPPPPNSVPTPQELIRTVLDGTIGQTFFPGIEAGVIMLDKSIYTSPFDFRFDGSKIGAGDITAMMALPWQADFFDCSTNWWPSQRPNLVTPQSGNNPDWARGIASERQMTGDVMRLGVVSEYKDSGGVVTIGENGRDPNLPS
jgi:hypothetical protein